MLDLPIPQYNPDDAKHRKIAELGAKARIETAKVIASGDFPLDAEIAKQRGFIRTRLETEMEVIDALVAKLLNK